MGDLKGFRYELAAVVGGLLEIGSSKSASWLYLQCCQLGIVKTNFIEFVPGHKNKQSLFS